MDFSYVHIRYFIGYVYHICLQDTIQSTLSLCLLCQAMLLPMPLRPLLLTTRSGFSVDLKHSAFLAQLLLEEVDLESTSEPAPPVGKPVLHMQCMHTGEPVARSPDALARPAYNNMPLSEHDTQELRQLLYLKAEGIERQ